MKRRDFTKYLTAAVPALTSAPTSLLAADSWSLTADLTESCSCAIPCPCNFGLPTEKKCEGSRLIEIVSGQINEIDLAGIKFVATFEMRKWANIYVDDSMSVDQNKAFEAIFPVAFGGFNKLAKGNVTRVSLTIERSANKVRFSVPASTVEIEKFKGLNGASVNISGLPKPSMRDYVQYESLIHTHKSDLSSWSHAKTNGFTSRMIVHGA
jgi:uncharacterized protein YqkB